MSMGVCSMKEGVGQGRERRSSSDGTAEDENPFVTLNYQDRVTESSGSSCIPISEHAIRQVFTARAAAQAGHHCI